MSVLHLMILSVLLSDQFILLRVPWFDLLGILFTGSDRVGAFQNAKLTSQKSVGSPEENGMTFSD